MPFLRKIDIEALPRYTYEDYKHWEGRWELIDGIAYAMSPQPRVRHQRISNNIAAELKRALEGCSRCFAVFSIDWKVNEDTVLQPDNLVICNEEDAPYITKPPALIFEILSPQSSFKDRVIKYRIYESQGVKFYVIVDIDAGLAEVYELRDASYVKILDARNETVNFDLGDCNLMFDFSKIW